jgi:transposase
MFKLCLLEYLYKLSDPEIVKRTQTDVAYRWFLGLNIADKVPDNTTISHFRSKRLGDKLFEEFINAIVKTCIDKELVKSKRYMIDSTDVAANIACNIIRIVTLISNNHQPSFSISKIE